MRVPFVDLRAQYRRIESDIQARIQAVLEHGQYIMGPEVQELEQALSRFAGGPHTVAVSSGTDALLMALMALGVGPGDAVFIPAFTFSATAEVVLLAGATPVFVDVDPRTFNIDPAQLAEQVVMTAARTALRPRVAIAVDLFGLPADYGAGRRRGAVLRRQPGCTARRDTRSDHGDELLSGEAAWRLRGWRRRVHHPHGNR
jgi:dTDP-4-amino-4,6-dideoxygalactose transaminase